MKSGSLKVEERLGRDLRTQLSVAGFEEGRRGPRGRGSRQLLEAQKDNRKTLPPRPCLELLESNVSCQYHDLGLVSSMADRQNCEV